MHTHPRIEKVLNIFEQLSRYISITLFFYIFISQITKYTSLETVHFDDRMSTQPYLKFMILTALSTGIAGMILAHFQGKKSLLTFTSFHIREKIVLIMSALFFSIFLMGDNPSLLYKFLIVCETFLLTLILPRLIGFYTATKIKHLIVERSMPQLSFRTVLTICIALTVVSFSAFVLLNIVSTYLSGQVIRNQQTKSQLYIKAVSPSKTAHAETINILGYNFGWRTNDKYKLMNDLGEIPVSEWTNEKITFVVPLHLKEGLNNLWIQKPDEKDPKKIILSNKIQMTIVSRFSLYPLEDDPLWKRALKKANRILFFKVKFLNRFIY